MPTVIRSDPRARQKPCLRCGYSLRNLPDAKLCPECGLPIWISLNDNDYLHLCNPDWLRKLRNGCYTLAAAKAIAIVFLLSLNSGLAPFALVALCALVVGGLVQLAWPEGRYPDRLRGPRLLAQACGALVLLAAILVVFRMEMLLLIGLYLAPVAAAIAPWPYLRKLLIRVPHQRLARWTGAMLIFPGAALLLLFPAVGYVILQEAPWLVIVGGFVYFPVSIVVLCFNAASFAGEIPEATRNWNSGGSIHGTV